MEKRGYEISIETSLDVQAAEQAMRGALAEQGFGILTEIDIAATLKTKIDVTVAPYKILGACNPTLAYQALGKEPEIGLLLPCNVTLREVGRGTVRISAVDPAAMLSVSTNPNIRPIAEEARTRLVAALASIEDA